MASRFWFSLCAALVGAALVNCGGKSSGNIDGGPGSGDGGIDGSTPLADAGADANFFDQFNDAGLPLCATKSGTLVVCQCSDGIDNESPPDGFIDAADPDCTGPFDNDESSLATGVPGDNKSPYVQDCFFDGDSGGGNDGCRWDIRCMDFEPPYEGTHCNNQKLDGCGFCQVLTPNGCDCFGCCEVFVGGQSQGYIRITEGCTLTDVAGTCQSCTPVPDCLNTCEECEQCIGKDPDPSCTPDQICPGGEPPCDVDGSCLNGLTCVSGCCKNIIIVD
jgi:hypothetical protein